MIELLKDFPDNVVAFAFHGRVTKADYDEVLITDFEDRLARSTAHSRRLRPPKHANGLLNPGSAGSNRSV